MIYGFIPVRKGSKGIPHKNVKLFLGKPLVLWLVDAMSASYVDEVVVATDDEEVVAYLQNHAKVSIFQRSSASAASTAQTEDVMIEWATTRRMNDDDIVILGQVTSPYTTFDNVNQVIGGIELGKKDSILTGYAVRRFFWRPNGEPMNYDPAHRPRRQDAPPFYMENGALYATRIGALKATKCRVSGRVGVHLMKFGFELDSLEDWEIGEKIMEYRDESYFV